MDFKQLHFARPLWLFCLLVPFILALLYPLFDHKKRLQKQLEKFIDPHLLPFLLVTGPQKHASFFKPFLLWSFAWFCLTLAIAGPRLGFREFDVYTSDQSLVVLLDLSQSMDATDVKPSRLVRARQKIEDIINCSKNLKMSLIAFAQDPHMITPLTDDLQTIRRLLPFLDTDLAFVQGSKLTNALIMASHLLKAEPGKNKAILVISDGGFEDGSAIATAAQLADQEIVVYTMGVGTAEGGAIKDKQGNYIKKNGTLVLSKLEKDKLEQLSIAGKGRYLHSDYLSHDETILLNALEKKSKGQLQERKTKIWEEHFYLLLIPVIPIALLWFRRGYLLAALFILAINPLNAAPTYFMNSEEKGKRALEEKDYQKAQHFFQDPFRKGVAYYRAGNFAEAENFFRQSKRKEVARQAAYNVGNSLVFQQKLQEAIQAYENVLKQWPEDQKAKDNLEIVKKMLKNQKNTEQTPSPEGNSGPENESKKEEHNQENNESNTESKKTNAEDSGEKQQSGNDDTRSKENHSDNEEESSKAQEENIDEGEFPPNSNSMQGQGKRREEQTPEDIQADQWLNQISNDPKNFLKNKFIIESKRNGTKEAADPW